jgi:hypothetical protein
MHRSQEHQEAPSPSIGPRANPRATMLGLRAALVGAILFGAFCILRADHDSRRDRPSLFWPSATGTITSCETRFYGGRHPHYGVDVSYSYEVNGAFLASHQIELWNPGLTGDRQTANSFVQSHPVQSTVVVYYNPNHPDNAALIPGADETGNNVGFISGSLLLLAGIWGFFKSLPGFGASGEAASAPRKAGGGRVSPRDRIT